MDESDELKDRKNMHWSPAMDRCMIETLLQQVQEGKKCPNGFKPTAYAAAVNALNQQFSSRLSRQHIINRLKTMKNTHRKVLELIGRSGIGWNDQTKMLDVSEEHWKEFILKNPDMDKKLNKKRFELFDKMCEVFGGDHATGEWARSRKRSRGSSEERVPMDNLRGSSEERVPVDSLRGSSEERVPVDNLTGSSEERVPVDSLRGSFEERVPVDNLRGSSEERVPVDSLRGCSEERVPLDNLRGSSEERVPVDSLRGSSEERIPVDNLRGSSEERVPVDNLNSPSDTEEDTQGIGRGSKLALSSMTTSQPKNVGVSSRAASSDQQTNEKKRKRVGRVYAKEIKNLGKNVGRMAQAFERAALSFERTAASVERTANSVVDPSVVLASVQEVEGLSEEEIIVAYDCLCENERKAKAFLALPPRMRLGYLKRYVENI
ncbi:L10-interacting MYB domain-containing protein-like isoform X1 [Macadamia integrifolia]|uniref:L10-interacting MYB domain-containing protein-like isoform X1 n=1 Tax=Macadamia integrifolia TaxID=60698 RepID=UPI001C53315D|nr:L10-interacting MYB domain-containing protein-like isoform X1 [Macadamia integrifolia]